MIDRNKNKSILSHIGNGFIIISLIGLLYTLYPLLRLSLFPKNESLPPNTTTSIAIPKIHALSPIIENVDPWNESLYKKALQKGVAQADGSSSPEEGGTVYLFAHSSGLPWEQTRFNTIFLKLGELRTGDSIELLWHGKKYHYSVYDRKVVSPKEITYLRNTQKKLLILQTCTPIGTDWNRLLIFAKRT